MAGMMAISWEADTRGLLKSWQVRFRVSPWGFNQVSDTIFAPEPSLVFFQAQREIIATSVAAAFDKSIYWLGYPIRPIFIEGELIDFGRLVNFNELLDSSTTYDTRYGHVQGFGAPAHRAVTIGSLTEAKSPDLATIPDNNVYSARLLVAEADRAIAAASASHPMLYFAAAHVDDNEFAQYDGRLAIAPRSVNVADTGAEIRLIVDKADIVNPLRQMSQYRSEAGAQLENKLDIAGDIYASASQLEARVTARDESKGAVALSYDDGGRSVVETPLDVVPIDKQEGRFRLARQSADQVIEPNNAFALRVNYEAGYPLQRGRIDPELELAMLRLANADFAYARGSFREAAFANYQDDFVDLFDRTDNTQIPVIDRRVLDLGTKRGHFEAGNVFKRRALQSKRIA